MTRTRTKTREAFFYHINEAGAVFQTPTSSEIERFTDALYTARRKPCCHSKAVKPHSGWTQKSIYGVGSGHPERGVRFFAYAGDVNSVLSTVGAELPKAFQFKFQKNNGLDLLATIGELDDTIAQLMGGIPAMFGSYGAVKWGTLPLFSDLKNLWSSLVDLCSKDRIGRELEHYLKSKSKDITHTSHHSVTKQYGNKVYDFSGQVRDTGEFSFDLGDGFSSKQIAAAIFLDEIGFHPDLQVLWELTPLSFVVDWFVPVGQALNAVHPRGWFVPKVRFFGQRTYKAQCDLYSPATVETFFTSQGVWSSTRWERALPEGSYDCFYRSPEQDITFNENVSSDVTWKAPSLSNWYDTGYIATSTRLNKTRNPKLRANLTGALDILATLGSTQF